METHLSNSDKIIMICTDKYVDKANKGQGGVGYEKMIITSTLMRNIDENKIIPIIRQKGSAEVPTFLKSKLYINFSKSDDFEFSYDELVRTIHNSPLFKKPPIGNNPFKPVTKEKLDGDFELLIKVLVAVIEAQGTDDDIDSDHVVENLKISPVLYKIAVTKLEQMGYAEWVSGHTFVRTTDKGLLYAYENKFLKDL